MSQSIGGPVVSPGGEASVIADLTPGQYTVICMVPEADGTPHDMLGMYAPLEVTEPASEAGPPTAEMTVDVVDFAFEMPAMVMAPPFKAVGGVSPMNPGYTNWAVLDFAPGDYVAICFVPEPETGAPHFALGMSMPFAMS